MQLCAPGVSSHGRTAWRRKDTPFRATRGNGNRKNIPQRSCPRSAEKYLGWTNGKMVTTYKYSVMKYVISFLMALVLTKVQAQYPAVTIPGSEVRKITSKIVAGQEYELHIMLPGGYKAADKKYPVVYLMDSQWDFSLVAGLYSHYYYDGFIPELIIVGVTWSGEHVNYDSLRIRDYSPTKLELVTIEPEIYGLISLSSSVRMPQSGGADQFLAFMKQELFPFIESNYKADGKNRTLMGCS